MGEWDDMLGRGEYAPIDWRARAGRAESRARQAYTEASAAEQRADEAEAALSRVLADVKEFADSRGVNVGDEDSDWWQGYRQAQRECLHDASALLTESNDESDES